ncbi:DUF397 domain-containing protein [Spirillospora sp. NPDC047279]|uniref:DUF397 domain-containing protein n=1 Tax=Spirillospora sp. NPDC047279 TaxID=3155478 RepID=UPI0033DC3041
MSTSDLLSASWRKSSHSGGDGGQCVELAGIGGGIAIRDSKDPHGPVLQTTRHALATAISRHTAA